MTTVRLLPAALMTALRLEPILEALRLLKTTHALLGQEPRRRLERAEHEIRLAIDELHAEVDAVTPRRAAPPVAGPAIAPSSEPASDG